MPAEPIDYSDDQQAVVYVRMPGWLHNLIVAAARGEGLSVNGWAVLVLKQAAESGVGLPAPPVAHAAVPTLQDIVEGRLLGRTVLEPCGKLYPCERHEGTHEVGGSVFCNHCRIRIS
jgi:hypothetical protein